MKKNKVFSFLLETVVLFCFCLVFINCNGNKNNDLNYRQACEEQDFSKAYNIVDQLKQISLEKNLEWKEAQSKYGTMSRKQEGPYEEYVAAEAEADKAYRYVVLQEAMLLLEKGDDGSLMRIVGLAKEHDADSWIYDELIDIANKIGNEELANRLKKMSGQIE